ncbi:MAG: EamA family transporter [Dehalococcoidia bacterium]
MKLATRIQQWRFLGYGFGFAAASAYGSTQFLARHVVLDYAHPIVVVAFSITFGFLILLVLFQQEVPQVTRAPRRALFWAVVAGLAAALGVSSQFSALSIAPVVRVSPIIAVNPLIALVLTHIFLQRLEQVTLRIVMGTALVVGGVVLVIIS